MITDLAAGIALDGIAYAGAGGTQPATWFSGDDYVTLASSTTGILQSSLFLCMMEVSFSVWTGTQEGLISNKRTATTGWDIYRSAETQISFRRHNTSTVVSFSVTSNLCTIAAYQSATTAKVFFNGTPATGTTISITPGIIPVYIGRLQTATLVHYGVIRNVRLYNTTGLSDAQIETIIATPTSATPAMWLKGDGNLDSNWIDYGSEGTHNGTLTGTSQIAYVKGNTVIPPI